MVRRMKLLVVATALALVAPVGAQDQNRVNEILMHAEARASNEADAAFELGDYPTIVQNQRAGLQAVHRLRGRTLREHRVDDHRIVHG